MGRLEVVCGSMFSGKTEELIRRLKRAQLARQEVMVFKPALDDRYSGSEVASHDDNRISCISVQKAMHIWDYLDEKKVKVVGIDEVQFFGPEVVEVIERLLNMNIRVIVAGLDTDWKGRPFHPVPSLLAIAEDVQKLKAICVVCGKDAARTQKVASGDSQVEVGAHDVYEARCREHFVASVQEPTQLFRDHLKGLGFGANESVSSETAPLPN
jgi:thymidine kinase